MTYETLSGQKRPRRFLIAAGFITILLIVMFAGAFFQRATARRAVLAAPQALVDELPTLTPTSTHIPQHPTQTLEPCPLDASQWRLGEIIPDNHLKAIQPSCVYDSLTPVLIWHQLTRQGYTSAEAAELLGLGVPPVGRRTDSISGLTSTGDRQQIPLTQEALHPEHALWQVDSAGQPLAQAYSLRGCYRPFSVVAGQIEDWDTGYDLICTLTLDHPAGWAVIQMGDLIFAAEMPAYRQFYLFGNTGSQWKQIGIFKGLDTPIENEASFAQDRVDQAQRIGWDPARVDIDFPTQPLPPAWQTRNDPETLQAIIARLEREQ